MKKILVHFVPTRSIFALLLIVGAYFIEDIFSLIKLNSATNSFIITGSDIQILLCIGIVGLVGILRKR